MAEPHCGGGVLKLSMKTDSFKSVKEFSHQNQEKLEIFSTELRTVEDKKILYCCCYRPPDADLCWIDNFEYFLHAICDQYENVVIAGDNQPSKYQLEIDGKYNGSKRSLLRTSAERSLPIST